MDTPIIQASIPRGDVDILTELWATNIIDWFNEEVEKGSILDMGEIYEGGAQFFVIPQWVSDEYNIKTIEDLKDPEVARLFQDPEDSSKGAFYNCIIGWQCAELNRAKIKAYGLDEYYNIISPGSAAALDAALAGAQRRGDPVFGYYFAPTSIMGSYDWYIIEEPPYTEECWAEVIKGRDDLSYVPAEACAYITDPVVKIVNKDLPEKAPDVHEFLGKMHTGLDPLNDTAAWANENDVQDWTLAAVYYLRTYEDRWKAWVPADVAEKVEEALAGES